MYSCDLDFVFRESHLPTDTTFYPYGITKKSVQKQKEINYNKELRLEVVSEIKITGNFLRVADNVLRAGCSLQRENVDRYNKYFQGIVFLVNKEYHQFSIMTQSRLIKQLLSKLESNKTFYESKFGHKMTVLGYVIKVPKYSNIGVVHIVATKIILDDKVYE